MQHRHELKFLLQAITGITLLFFAPVNARAQNGVYFIPTTKQADSVHEVLTHTRNDTLKMSAYYYLSSYYTELNKDSAEYYGDLQLDMARRLHQKLWAADALFQVAYITYGLSNYPKSLTSVTEGLTICGDEGAEKNNWKAGTFSFDGNPHRARLFIAAALHQIFAFLYTNVGDSPKAAAQFLTAIKIAESVDDQEELSLDDMSLGAEYMEAGKPDSALLLQNKALVYAYKSKYKIYLGTILTNIGEIYFAKKDYAAAGKFYHNAVQASISQNNLKDEIRAFLSVAQLQRATAKLDSSLFYARKALATAEQFKMSSEEARAYSSLFSVFKRMNKTDSAFAYLQLAKTLDDSLNDAETLKTNQYQRLNLNEQISQREAEKAKIQSENKTRVYVLLAGIAILLLVAFLLFRNNRNRKKANDLLHIQKQQIGEQKEKVESTLAELKNTQKQLIQSEKMASLGELTAGIAHEIQNPLNFVNNFSEVSNELIDEMKEELTKGDIEEAIFIADDIRQNLEKINQHGKRADAIVKGMLQHSRQTKGVKELTDINALCAECLTLSYHAMRAKDKTFRADIKTDFDESIGKINIVSQNVGRVLLNIIGNAFYATDQRHKADGEQFKPVVSLQTKRSANKIEIAISDNGGGIATNIIEKIFQPFFTTKPTGQGTGLGLSLAYDIITKEHDGTLMVKSDEGEGSEFVISIPMA